MFSRAAQVVYPNIQLMNTHNENEQYLFMLYVSSRQDEISAWGWSDEMVDSFMHLQWHAQMMNYRHQFPELRTQIIFFNQQPAGRLFTNESSDVITLVDIIVEPEMQNKGIGTHIIQYLMKMSSSANKQLVLQVIEFNRAVHLYERLGFKKTGYKKPYFAMTY